jgi:hypothetical protein
MAHVAFEAKPRAERGALAQPLQLGLLGAPLQLAISAGVQFDHRRSQHDGGFELARIGLDEQGDADAGVAQPGDHRLQVIVLAGGVEATLGGPLLALLGHDAGGMRRVPSAMPTISGVAAISKLSGGLSSRISASMSHRRCGGGPRAGARDAVGAGLAASAAARSGSGSCRRARCARWRRDRCHSQAQLGRRSGHTRLFRGWLLKVSSARARRH